MQFDPNGTYVARQGVVMRRVGDETLLVPVSGDTADTRNVYVLNAVAEYVWGRFDGKRPLNQICRDVADVFDVSEAEAQSDTRELTEELLGLGLVGLAE